MISTKAKIGKNTFIHPLAYIEDDVVIGENCHIGPFCIVRNGAIIGDNCKFTAYCEIRNNCKVGSGTSMGSRCTLSANVIVEENVVIKYGFVATDTPNLKEGNKKVTGVIGKGSLIGANVTLMPGVNIGKNSIIGANSQVRKDVPDNEVWFGIPAKFYKKNF